MKIILIILSVFTIYSFTCTQPVIFNGGCTLYVVDSYQYGSFQWYKNSVLIPDEIYPSIEGEIGSYVVRTTDGNGCINYSKRIKVTTFCGGN